MAQRLAEFLLCGWCLVAWLPEEVLHARKKCAIAQKKHVYGVGEKRQRQYGYIKEKAEKSEVQGSMAYVPRYPEPGTTLTAAGLYRL
jgi:hypothetical protein